MNLTTFGGEDGEKADVAAFRVVRSVCFSRRDLSEVLEPR